MDLLKNEGFLEKAILEKRINYHDYSEFIHFKKIGIGEFGDVYKAEWKKCGIIVALKRPKNNKSLDTIIHELMILQNLSFHHNIIEFYGVTKDPNGYYNIVMSFAEDGDLRQYLKRNSLKLTCTDKLRIAREITLGLSFLHKKDVVHFDLHTENILVHKEKMMIADFGLSSLVTDLESSPEIHGMPAFIEPKYFIDPSYKLTKKSDIYSLGVILWEISSCQTPFENKSAREIIFHISLGIRETPIKNMPLAYVELYEHCWNDEPINRPETKIILEKLDQIKELYISIKSYDFNLDRLINNIKFSPKKITDAHKFEWEKKEFATTVVLKCLKDKINLKEFLLLQNIISFYNLTEDMLVEDGLMVVEFANDSNLREYLEANFSRLYWVDKFRIAKQILQGLTFLHANNLVHRGLHSKNILVLDGKPVIADFGLTKRINDTELITPIHKMPEYVDPQYLKFPSYQLDTKSDIYSFGVILWELSSGRRPFQSFTSTEAIAIHIFRGNRETPVEGTPTKYVDLYTKCWDNDPDKRPDIKYIFKILNCICNTFNQEDQINTFNYSEFSNPEKIADGLCKLEWKNYGMTVALKSLKTEISPTELLLLQKVAHHPNINSFYGLTKDLPNENYSIILEFAMNSNLHEYLKINFKHLRWIDKLRMAKQILQGLAYLHANHLIHRNLHSKNILVHNEKLMIADFGFPEDINDTKLSTSIHKMPEYIDPQCFKNPSYQLDTKSDIYSFGVVLWEISSGRRPFQSFTSKEAIVIHIFRGNRETPVEDTPTKYVDLYTKCWDDDPVNRPEIKSVRKILNRIHSDLIKNYHINTFNYGEFSNLERADDVLCVKLPGELAVLQLTRHPNIISFHSLIKGPPNDHYSMTANNGNLREYLKTNFKNLKWIDKLRIAKGISQGLAFLHANKFVHRNLRPKNILIQKGKR